jgi:hypothetical protein
MRIIDSFGNDIFAEEIFDTHCGQEELQESGLRLIEATQ